MSINVKFVMLVLFDSNENWMSVAMYYEYGPFVLYKYTHFSFTPERIFLLFLCVNSLFYSIRKKAIKKIFNFTVLKSN